jgi:hypothetical protein
MTSSQRLPEQLVMIVVQSLVILSSLKSPFEGGRGMNHALLLL